MGRHPRDRQPRRPARLLRVADAGLGGGQEFFNDWFTAGPLLVVLFAAAAGLVAAAAGLVAATVAVVRNRDLGVSLAVPVIWGLIVVSFALGELTNPH